VGVNTKGYHEILGLRIGLGESEDSWSEFLGWLVDRGLKGVNLVASEDHRGC